MSLTGRWCFEGTIENDRMLRAQICMKIRLSDWKWMLTGVCKEMEAAAGRDSGTLWTIIDVGGSKTNVSPKPMQQTIFDQSCREQHGFHFLSTVRYHLHLWSDESDVVRMQSMLSSFLLLWTLLIWYSLKIEAWIVWSVYHVPWLEDQTYFAGDQEDSVMLWKSVCSNKILKDVELVLFLNKCDILEAKLESGVRLSKYVRSFGTRENNKETVAACGWIFD